MGNHGKSWEIMGNHGKSWEIMISKFENVFQSTEIKSESG